MDNINDNLIASITELKRDPLGLIGAANNLPVTILSHNKPSMMVMSVDFFEQLLEDLDDARTVIQLIQEGRIDVKNHANKV